MNELQVFNFQNKKVRNQIIDGQVWWVAKDVCDILEISKYRDALEKLDDDERELVKVDTLGGRQEMAVISESGLYALIFRSNKPRAKPFRKWVTSEVLPTLRRTGSYNLNMGSDNFISGSYPEIINRLAHEVYQKVYGKEGGKKTVDALTEKMLRALCRVVGREVFTNVSSNKCVNKRID